MTRPCRRFRPEAAPLEARLVLTVTALTAPPPPASFTVTNEEPPAPASVSPWAYLDRTDRTPVDRLPDPLAVAPLAYWARLYGLGQIQLRRDRAKAELAAMVAQVDALEAAPPGPLHDETVLWMSAMVSEQMSEVRRLDGLRDWWLEIPVSDPEFGGW